MSEVEECWLSIDEIHKYLGGSTDIGYRWFGLFGMPAHLRVWKLKKDQAGAWVKAGAASAGLPKKDVGTDSIK